ncbi:glycosyltransferase-like protein gnt14 [Aphidius gifuensis]|uniref:glycosyltransferase-like protein gnt14 n=1 Tax=Aphidius gifuensis TaxID=684658 RepID=UPI001CDC07B9|nr:glycosyltransferase-like protein gnt14 [Aphidius gifuensis]
MIAILIKSVLLFGVIGWYSTNVWKIIDVYFKEKFEKYLQDEYAKNPKMKIDIQSPIINEEIISTISNNDYCNFENCPDNKINSKTLENLNTLKSDNSKKIELISNEEKKLKPIENNKININNNEKIKTKIKNSKLLINKKTNNNNNGKKKKKLSDKKKKVKSQLNDDFSEFDYENEKPHEGIPISELGFKPKADIGKLDRINAEEFCPISIDDNSDCFETKKWP